MHIKMSRSRNASSPNLLKQSVSTPSSPTNWDRPEDSCLEGCTTTLKLLIKLIQEHNEMSERESDERKMKRVTGMINILDEVRSRLHKSQSSYGNNKRVAELRRCNTDLRPRRPADHHSMPARKTLEVMCSSLGKEKEIMASELSKKVHQLNEMEEHISDLKGQNDLLLAKLHSCTANDHATTAGGSLLAEQNKMMSEQLLKALEGFKTLKRKLKEARNEKEEAQSAMVELGKEVSAGLDRVRGLKHRLDTREDQSVEAEISALQHVLESLDSRFSMQGRKPKPNC